MNRYLKSCLQSGVGIAARLSPKVRHARTTGISIFVFHDVSSNKSPFSVRHGLTVSPDLFRDQVEWITRNFNVIHPDRLLSGDTPKGSAVLTFDDGWAGTFREGFPVLESLGLPALAFLNLEPIQEGSYLASAMADYLGAFEPSFKEFASENGLTAPYHLSLTPESYERYVETHGTTHEENQIIDQGQMADRADLDYWDGHDLFRYANHLYNHWNAASLTDSELKLQYNRNEDLLKSYASALPLFAYPNGQPGTCYLPSQDQKLLSYGANRLFSATGRINTINCDKVLDRIALGEWHDRVSRYWYGFGRKTLL